jgi:peptidyl-tRNA hydrolase
MIAYCIGHPTSHVYLTMEETYLREGSEVWTSLPMALEHFISIRGAIMVNSEGSSAWHGAHVYAVVLAGPWHEEVEPVRGKPYAKLKNRAIVQEVLCSHINEAARLLGKHLKTMQGYTPQAVQALVLREDTEYTCTELANYTSEVSLKSFMAGCYMSADSSAFTLHQPITQEALTWWEGSRERKLYQVKDIRALTALYAEVMAVGLPSALLRDKGEPQILCIGPAAWSRLQVLASQWDPYLGE